MRVLSGVLFSAALLLGACSNAASDPVAPAPAEATSAVQAQGNWIMDKDQSRIAFEGVQKGKAFTGEFGAFDASINFNPNDLAASSVTVTIDVSSIDAGNSERNESLPSKDWFHVKAFPAAIFTANEFSDQGEGNYIAKGTLTIRDQSRPVTLPFTLNIDGERAVMSSESFTLDRTDYGVGQGTWGTDEWVDTQVKVNVSVVATRS